METSSVESGDSVHGVAWEIKGWVGQYQMIPCSILVTAFSSIVSYSRCTRHTPVLNTQDEEPDDSILSSIMNGMYPGTLWCGWDNVAGEFYSKLGR